MLLGFVYFTHTFTTELKNRMWDFKILKLGVLTVAQRKQIQLGTMSMWVQSLASLSGLRIWCCRELWFRSQTWLGSCITVDGVGWQL